MSSQTSGTNPITLQTPIVDFPVPGNFETADSFVNYVLNILSMTDLKNLPYEYCHTSNIYVADITAEICKGYGAQWLSILKIEHDIGLGAFLLHWMVPGVGWTGDIPNGPTMMVAFKETVEGVEGDCDSLHDDWESSSGERSDKSFTKSRDSGSESCDSDSTLG